ncbi:universal stress protein [Natronobacterium gregoryi]|uniref:Universal stress protein n=2 Tax=Natronobacterium gregoryi TaxID=44930 RepID=L0AI47_NATGS|nr:universal stress protein [Natronobacterium gregoryi]AFZ73094.1 universal stress protein UspA-like protein [Natronobacterium gregoryi SP2]ELY70807.1 UspA domain-containing protein [Natronobacterium gregoryi SP2]PLK20386.1 universal stress protein [Natronobacterium gregoryi SP2]SFI61308.1 Nucleotide-binding universal stress protein, UspA family [Natronobacterium gregoryi]
MDDIAQFSVDTVLAPVDGSDESATAVEYAVSIADRHDADVHALFVLGRGVVRGLDAGTVDEDDVAQKTQGFFDDVGSIADDQGVTLTTSVDDGFSQTRKARHPGNVVLNTADEVDADFIVLPREPVTEPSAEVLEKAAEYVLSYASQPVLSV